MTLNTRTNTRIFHTNLIVKQYLYIFMYIYYIMHIFIVSLAKHQYFQKRITAANNLRTSGLERMRTRHLSSSTSFYSN